jgi:hypothetical protein
VRLRGLISKPGEDLQALSKHRLEVVRLLVYRDPRRGLRHRPVSGRSVHAVVGLVAVLELPRGLDELLEVFVILD